MEVVPEPPTQPTDKETASLAAGLRELPRVKPLAARIFSNGARASHGMKGGALCRPMQPSPSQSAQETWRERPRYARSQRPRACPEGSLTPWVHLSFAPGNSGVICRSERRPCVGKPVDSARFPGRSVPGSAEDPGQDEGTVLGRNAGAIRQSIGSGVVDGLRSCYVSRCADERDGGCDAGHHGLDAGAVLGSVQGSPLRFDRGLRAAFGP